MKLQTTVLATLAACFVPHALAATTPALRGVIAQPSAAAIPKLCEQSIAQARTRIEQIKAAGYNLDQKNPHVGEVVDHDPDHLLANYARLQGEAQALRDELKGILAKSLSSPR